MCFFPQKLAKTTKAKLSLLAKQANLYTWYISQTLLTQERRRGSATCNHLFFLQCINVAEESNATNEEPSPSCPCFCHLQLLPALPSVSPFFFIIIFLKILPFISLLYPSVNTCGEVCFTFHSQSARVNLEW